MGDVEYAKIDDFYLPPAFLRLYNGPSINVEHMWRIMSRGTINGGLAVGTIIKLKLGLQPKPFGEACYSFWQGGDFIKNDEPQDNLFCQVNEYIPEVVKTMRACIKGTNTAESTSGAPGSLEEGSISEVSEAVIDLIIAMIYISELYR